MPEFSLRISMLALTALAVLTLAGAIVRHHVRVIAALSVPNSVTAGTVALLLGPQVLGRTPRRDRCVRACSVRRSSPSGRRCPGMLINVVFAAILLGRTIPDLRTLGRRSLPAALFGATLAFGQYAVGLLLAVLVLTPVFDMNVLAGGLLEMSLTGGHGTVAGMAPVMVDLGFAEGPDLGLGLATVGLVSGVVIGTMLVNRAARAGRSKPTGAASAAADADADLDQIGQSVPLAYPPDPGTSPMTVTVGVIALAVTIGWLLQQALVGVTVLATGDPGPETFASRIPLFPFTILGGAALQLIISAGGWSHLVPRAYVNNAAGIALDLLVVASIATLSLSTVGANLLPFALLAATGLAWTVLAVTVLGPRIYGPGWFERAMGDLGQSSGTVATGYLLMRMADPDDSTGARECFGYKQLLFEPLLGGGLVTAFALPLVHTVGGARAALAALACTVLCALIGISIRARTTSTP